MNFNLHKDSTTIIDMLDWKSIVNQFKFKISIIDSNYSFEENLKNPISKVVILDTTKITTATIDYCKKECSLMNKPIIALVHKDTLLKIHFEKDYKDFIITPVNNEELAARIRKILSEDDISFKKSTIQIGDISINSETYEVFVKENRITLRFKEFQLLQLLISNPEKVYTRENLLNQIWGYNYFGGTRTVDVHILRLRSKISDSGSSLIETIWNVGYRFRKK